MPPRDELYPGTIYFQSRSYPMKNVGCAMYPWPFGEFDIVMDDALNIAMDYLIRTGQVVKFQEAQEVAAQAIAVEWRSGVRNRLRLSNLAIRAVQQKADLLKSG
jgi:hypothetical protein